MKMPWQGTTGLAKAVAILAVGLGISIGLCGLNFIAVTTLKGDNSVLIVTAYLELAGMIICAAGLMIVAIIAVSRMIAKALKR